MVNPKIFLGHKKFKENKNNSNNQDPFIELDFQSQRKKSSNVLVTLQYILGNVQI